MQPDLDLLIYHYYEGKKKLEEDKKRVESFNQKIKSIMEENDFDEYVTEDGVFKAKKIVQNRESFVEPQLIEKLKQLHITSPIKTVEVIDYDELENVIYKGQLNASELSEFKETKQVITLKVTTKKGE